MLVVTPHARKSSRPSLDFKARPERGGSSRDESAKARNVPGRSGVAKSGRRYCVGRMPQQPLTQQPEVQTTTLLMQVPFSQTGVEHFPPTGNARAIVPA